MPTIPGVVGTDQIPPLYQPDDRWTTWSMDEIWLGTHGDKKFIPKVKDHVVEPETFQTYIVDSLDPVTYVPTLRPIKPSVMNGMFPDEDVLFGVGPGTQADTYRVYLDKNNFPYTLSVDNRLRVGGSKASYCKIFKGTVLDNGGEVISKMYDSNGVFVSENVPLELIAIDSHINYSIKTPMPCKCTVDLVDGEIVTLVNYASDGSVLSKRQLLAENSTFIRSLNVSLKYITQISLESPFKSPTIENQIDYPLNVPIDALNLIGVVHYSDGSTLRLPVDGTKFSMYGLDQWISTIIDQEFDLVLRYSLSDDEVAICQSEGNGHFISVPYKITVNNPNNSYSVKLFAYPYWVSDNVGYQLKFWMLNLDRNVWFDVTDKVQFNQQQGPYDPKAYGYMQKKSVSLNLRDVSGSFKPFIHVQMIDIVLNMPPDGIHTPWTISQESNVSRPFYGEGLFAKRKSGTTVNLSCGITDFNEWKQRVYLNTFPLVNPASEVYPMSPTHFVVNYDGLETEFPIDDWNQDINIGSGIAATNTIAIRFIKRTSSGTLQLSVAAMIVNP